MVASQSFHPAGTGEVAMKNSLLSEIADRRLIDL
jgi:hypothetical protein